MLPEVAAQQADEQADQGRFAGAIRAEQPVDLALADGEAHAIDGTDRTEVLMHIGGGNHGVGDQGLFHEGEVGRCGCAHPSCEDYIMRMENHSM